MKNSMLFELHRLDQHGSTLWQLSSEGITNRMK